MESFGSILEGDWSCLDAMYSAEESEFAVQLLNYCSIPNDLNFRVPSDNADIDHFALGNTCFYPTLNHDSCYAGDFRHILAATDDFVLCNEGTEGENLSSVQILSSGDVYENVLMQLELEGHVVDRISDEEVVLSNPGQKSKKRSANSGDVSGVVNEVANEVQKNTRSVRAKKNQKIETKGCMNNKEKNAAVPKRSLSNDSMVSHGPNGVASNSPDSKEVTPVNSNGEVRAVRGSATDPQSLYAKKRRERINEKFRTLQKLVPNGTKVDISTMLEDAVEYVKFLQLQIKLLSSDKWMYAPIAYNGTDLGLVSNLSRPLH